jgi:hypothetical protein
VLPPIPNDIWRKNLELVRAALKPLDDSTASVVHGGDG